MKMIRALFTITMTTVAQLKELAQKWNKSKSEIIRDLVEKAWNEENDNDHNL